ATESARRFVASAAIGRGQRSPSRSASTWWAACRRCNDARATSSSLRVTRTSSRLLTPPPKQLAIGGELAKRGLERCRRRLRLHAQPQECPRGDAEIEQRHPRDRREPVGLPEEHHDEE